MAVDNFGDIYVPTQEESIIDWGKNKIDAGIQFYQAHANRRTAIELCYDSYNGVTNKQISTKATTATYGSESKTKLVKYRLGRSKINLLEGEYLRLGVETTVSTTNKTAIDEKHEQLQQMTAMMDNKALLEQVREAGLNIFPGFEIPDRNNPMVWEKLNSKSKNEIIMQHILDEKKESCHILSKFDQCVLRMILGSEAFAKIEKDNNGVDNIRVIDPLNAIYVEVDGDIVLNHSPLIGEKREMYLNDILLEYSEELKENPKLKKEIKDLFEGNNSGGDSIGGTKKVNGVKAADVYTIEWIAIRKEYQKITRVEGSDVPIKRTMSNAQYIKNKKRIDRDVKKGKYEINEIEKEDVWEATNINGMGSNMYLRIRSCPNQIHHTRGTQKMAKTNYLGILLGTVNGIRISMQEQIMNLDAVYDILMFQINRELGKIKGKVFVYDSAFMPKNKTILTILNQAAENGVIEVNSAADGNYSAEDVRNSKDLVKEIELGAFKSLETMLVIKQNIEQSVDRITGINDARQGVTQATTKVSNNESNLEASRSTTYSIYYYANLFFEELLLRLVEKTKLNWLTDGGDNPGSIISTKEFGWLKVDKNIAIDSYSVYLSNGRENEAIKDRLRGLYQVQINAGELRASDVAKAEMQDTMVGYINVLESAWDAIKKSQAEQEQAQAENANQLQKAQDESLKENREDIQRNEKDNIQLKGEIDKELKMLEGKIAAQNLAIKGKVDDVIQDKKLDQEKEMANESQDAFEFK